ncbi:MAG: type 4a pilus biogenesis protein PilO [bacterium]|nr:type 4a pilus biogenesis protein PilO [bacterium]
MDKKNLMKIIIGAVVLVGVLFLYWKFDFSKNASQISKLKGEFDNVNTQVNEARKVAARMSEYIERIKVLEGQLKVANRMLPDSQMLEDIIDTITLYANKNNVKIMNIHPTGIAVTSEYGSVNQELTLQCSFSSLGTFLTDLGNQKRIAKINDISIKPIKTQSENLHTIQAVVAVSTYYKGPGAAIEKKEGKDDKKKK